MNFHLKKKNNTDWNSISDYLEDYIFVFSQIYHYFFITNHQDTSWKWCTLFRNYQVW